MTKAQIFLAEIQQEAKATRKALEVVPMDKLGWKPHEKSMTLGQLAGHVAEIPGWVDMTLNRDELDFEKEPYVPFKPTTNEELVTFMDQHLEKATEILNTFPDAQMGDGWTMRSGEQVYFTLPKEVVMRTWCLNHWYHHRAQLGVYLRLLDIAVPPTYGPSADTKG